MNTAEVCHEVDGCPGLYVDAFRGRYLRRTQDPDNAFILTHYHGDHYQNLPRDGKYNGPALIHCTPVTSALLIRVHKVPAVWVVEHEYGKTFSLKMKGRGNELTQITFYDANHCPGACIVLIQLPNGTTHLHTGDMRYHERFKSYPLLREAVANNTLDIVYLDTTYGHPKHDFVPQDESVESIAGAVVELLGYGSDAPETSSKMPKTLLLLSCYSIGKEKVLWEAAARTNQLVYVTEKKFHMLQCVQGHESQEVSSQIIHRCTQNADETPIHAIAPWAGEIWPFFRPNFLKCADYARSLNQGYEKVVAFLPTGWAHGSKWNREHSVSQKTVPPRLDDEVGTGSDKKQAPIDVEVRLIPYSEHSAFSELVSFVQYLRPRKVIPTVFSDDADYRKIENRFRNLLDRKRAKQAFFRSMEKSSCALKSVTESDGSIEPTETCGNETSNSTPETVSTKVGHDDAADDAQSEDSVEIIKVETKEPNNAYSSLADESDLTTLSAMGFDSERARQALSECKGNVDRAVDRLLSGKVYSSTTPSPQSKGKSSTNPHISPNTDSSPNVSKKRKAPPAGSSTARITSFFGRKKKNS